MVHHFAPSLAPLALALPPATTNWVYQFTTNLANLTPRTAGRSLSSG